MITKNRALNLLAVSILIALNFSCSKKQTSSSTGWEYNNAKVGGFEVSPYREQITGPGLVLVEGGKFTMGQTLDNPMYEWDNQPRSVTVPSFYMDETEVSNLDYLEYLFWLRRVFGTNHPEVYYKALPDTLVWREKLAYNEPLVDYYLRHPAYHNYPVVGVSWRQANEYCTWRTDRVNEMLLVKQGILDYDPDQRDANNFNTEAYLAGQYQGLVNKPLRDLNPAGTGERQVRMEDGILLPLYRLPTEAEWEYAALGLIGNSAYERVVERRSYPWQGNSMREDGKKSSGQFRANFRRGRGDYMGVAGRLNDAADIPNAVRSYTSNDYGLYNMAGNVAEWVLDVYRPLTFQDVADYRPYRGNVFTTREKDAEGLLVEKDFMGRIKKREVTAEETTDRYNYRRANNINYRDGDPQSLIGANWNQATDTITTKAMYDYGKTSLISDKSRVYKGGSWRDPAYYLSPSVRRFMEEDKSTNYIGFRCAMTRVGSSNHNRKK